MSRQAYDKINKELIPIAGLDVIDSTPTQNSSHAVASGGVYDEINLLNESLNQKLDTKVIELADMAEYNNDLAMLPDGVFFVKSTVFVSDTIANRPFENISGALVISKRLPINMAKIMTVEPFVRTIPAYTGYGYPENDDWNWDSHVKTSNPNLLDNPWFTVNQRGQSQYTASTGTRVFTVDRWATASGATGGNTTVEPVTNGVNLTTADDASDNATLTQHFNDDSLFGKTVTISAIIDGVSYIATGTVPNAKTSSWQQVCRKEIEGVSIALLVSPSTSTNFQFEFIIRTPRDNTAYNCRACKLELGSVSTLAMDTAPNYATELLKCQRYFYRLKSPGNNDWIALGKAWSNNAVNVIVNVPPMRAFPTASVSDVTKLLVAKGSSSLDPHRITAIHPVYYKEFGYSLALTLDLSDSTATDGENYVLKSDTSVNIDFSADL